MRNLAKVLWFIEVRDEGDSEWTTLLDEAEISRSLARGTAKRYRLRYTYARVVRFVRDAQ